MAKDVIKSVVKGAIFDVDGTLLDSMGIWEDVGVRYLKSIGKEPEANLSQILFPMSIEEGAAYVKEHYELPYAIDEIIEGVLSIVRDFYYYEAPLKEGATELLAALKEKEISMVVATSSERDHIEKAFKRLGIDGYFEKIFTCSEVGESKSSPLIYRKSAEYLHTKPEETLVIEDALHALLTAKSAGFHTLAVYDEASEKDQEALKKEADVYVTALTELLS
ncbi:MAG: HAD family hydrolase [Lachnospiraceae bacterium]